MKETLEEAAEIYASHSLKEERQKDLKMGFIKGAKWQQEPEQFFSDDRVKILEKSIEYLLKRQERMYSEEDLRKAFTDGQDNMDYSETYGWSSKLTEQEWFEQFKKQ
jgi:hypothetical protein